MVQVGQIFELADKASFYKGKAVEVMSVKPGFAWVKLANYGPGSIEFNAKLEDLAPAFPPMDIARVQQTGRQFGQKIGKKEAALIAAILKGAK